MFHQIKSSENEGDFLAHYKDRWVDINSPNERSLGVYKGMKEDYLILNPHLVVEEYPSGRKLFILSREPRLIHITTALRVYGAREQFVKALLSDDYDVQTVKDLSTKSSKPNKQFPKQ